MHRCFMRNARAVAAKRAAAALTRRYFPSGFARPRLFTSPTAFCRATTRRPPHPASPPPIHCVHTRSEPVGAARLCHAYSLAHVPYTALIATLNRDRARPSLRECSTDGGHRRDKRSPEYQATRTCSSPCSCLLLVVTFDESEREPLARR